jgi:voltage-gated potassium channel Kch
MIIPLLFALGLVCTTVIIHALGTWKAIAHLAGFWEQKERKKSFFINEIHIVRVVGILLALHLLEAAIWAVFYRVAGRLPDLETAIYFSMTSYTTLGYGDVILPAPWRLLGPIEAATGILMFGWSTAIIVASITRIHAARFPSEGSTE